ncbi:CUE domain-containing protein 2-A-like [Limulus polyphemus]|uniref:CUE domain-containing protein 2-A-like n=1 Tax=Limulus polyphemus TaxID=6850 RepID=A0ABM1SKJ4_LIMPO|nr:CUE domain-containing protein 2-A-like [Limulus polyphemus]XP_022244142.1 CUE domain-containing protein 2-A-like [Limulus polyphemus]XP_022244150.1 CUE domain-containing protein 2-A-like [Limulus polyphemus]
MSTLENILESRDDVVKGKLAIFIKNHTGEDALGVIDEIVLSYVMSLLETLGNIDEGDDAFDVDMFSEMMAAYIPAFSTIKSEAICEWMFELAREMRSTCTNKVFPGNFKVCHSQNHSVSSRSCFLAETTANQLDPCRTHNSSSSSSQNISISSKSEEFLSSNTVEELDISHQIEILTEMFPNACMSEIQHCVSISGEDCEKAAQLILQRQETSKNLTSPLVKNSNTKPKTHGPADNVLDNEKLKHQILSKYGYIDQDDDVRKHRPITPKAEPEKLVRYRDNKVVSMKGERYSNIKKEESEEMKKTYISLKPARQYRFH